MGAAPIRPPHPAQSFLRVFGIPSIGTRPGVEPKIIKKSHILRSQERFCQHGQSVNLNVLCQTTPDCWLFAIVSIKLMYLMLSNTINTLVNHMQWYYY
jgi:hypothetical protein